MRLGAIGRQERFDMEEFEYLMESADESVRLEAKTDPGVVREQAVWAGIQPGMRVADLGCGSGKTTAVLHGLVQPGGTAVGIDASEERLAYGKRNFGHDGIEFVRRDLWEPADGIGTFDMVWMRFILEYFRSNALEIVQRASRLVKPGGILCLIDLDHNCLNHFSMSHRLERAILRCMQVLEEEFNFDPFAGRKLYSFVYDLGFEDVAVTVGAHHNIYGVLNKVDAFNWKKKMEMVARKAGCAFDEYEDGSQGFMDEFSRFFQDPRRFSYTPIVCVRGRKPL